MTSKIDTQSFLLAAEAKVVNSERRGRAVTIADPIDRWFRKVLPHHHPLQLGRAAGGTRVGIAKLREFAQ